MKTSGPKVLHIYMGYFFQREVHRLRMMRMFGPQREEVTTWRKLQNKELHNLYSSLNNTAAKAHKGEIKYAYMHSTRYRIQ